MKKQILIIIGVLVLINLTAGLSVGLRNFSITNTKITDLGYEVSVKDYNKYVLVFDFDNIDSKNIAEKVNEKLDVIDAIEFYDNRIANGQDGCSSTNWCHNNGWLEDTVCYRGRCIDSGFELELDKELDGVDKNKMDDLDNALGIRAK